MSAGAGQWERALSAAMALGTGALLAVSRWLEPSVAGHSTHLQLGLRPCTFLEYTGYPCPMCGMTTTFALLADLRPLAAVVNQPFGAVLFATTCVVFSVSLAETLIPRGRWSRLLDRLTPYEPRIAIIFFVGLGAGWLYKIATMRWL